MSGKAKKAPMDMEQFTAKAFRYFQLRQKWIGNGRGTQVELDEMRKLDSEIMKAMPALEAARAPEEKP